jgi:hypothetical protein
MLRAFLILGFVLTFPAGAFAQPPLARDLLSIYRDLNDMCRNRNDDDLHRMRACNIREKVARLLNTMGYCYGKKGQDAADMQWHKCAAREVF